MKTGAFRHAAWILWAISLVVTAMGLIVHGGPPPDPSDVALTLVVVSFQVAVATLGAFVVSRQPRNPVGWIFVAIGLLLSLSAVADAYADNLPVAAWFANLVQGPAGLGIFVFIFLLFPDGRLVSPRWRPVAWSAATAIVVLAIVGAIGPGPLRNFPSVRNPFGIDALGAVLDVVGSIAFAVLMLQLAAAALSLGLRFGRSRGDERLQLKWVASAAALAALLLLSGPLWWWVIAGPGWIWPVAFSLAAAIIPISIGVAMLKYRLYEIDLIINRTLVYGALTAIVVGLYVLVVAYLGNVLRASNNLAISLLATGLVAVLFQPLRERLQRSVNHLMYGERDDPYAVISRLGQRLEGTLTPQAVLPTIVETVAQALKLPYAAIVLREGDGYVVAASAGTPVDEPLDLPLIYQQENVGRLVLAPRAPGELFSSLDRRLLDDLARQAGVAAHAVRLTADLQRSRERLITAREEERRRLRRDLHDGLGPSLAAQTLKVGSARALYPHDAMAADTLLAELERDIEMSLTNVRRLVYNLRPPALDELGLVGAIRDCADHYRTPTMGPDAIQGLLISITAPDDLPVLPAAVEVAAYRIVQEALTNVVRHAQAERCWIGLTLESDDRCALLELRILDDGVGFAQERKAGMGLTSMRERAEELGGTCMVGKLPEGGTSVQATLPLVRL